MTDIQLHSPGNTPFKVLILTLSYLSSGLIGYFLILFELKDNHFILQVINMFLLSWVFVFWGFITFQMYPNIRLHKSYYSNKRFETTHFFRVIGVNLFRKILINSAARHLNKRVYLKGRDKNYIPVYLEETKRSETSHILAFAATFLITLYLLAFVSVVPALFLSVWNIIFNIYPILLQRMNRSAVLKRLR